MAILKQTRDGDHYYILAGPSQGTQQITREGLEWLLSEKLDRLPQREQDYPINSGTYRYLKDHGYLFVNGIPYEKPFAFSPLSLEIEGAEPGLLLCLNAVKKEIGELWTLRVKIDEIDEKGQEWLLEHADPVAIGCLSSMVDLNYIQCAQYWPVVTPQTKPYPFYWKNKQGQMFPLRDAQATSGLCDNWQGNVFFPFEHAELTNAWCRCLPKASISLANCRELYWLAKKEYEPDWPGLEQRIDDTKHGWQLWHLRINTDRDPLETVSQWLSYRSLRLIYPQWRLHVLSAPSFSSSTEQKYYYMGTTDHVLLRCDPPNKRREDERIRASLQLTLPPTTTDSKLPIESTLLCDDEINYLLCPVPNIEQEYRIRVKGEASGPSLSLRKSSLQSRQQAWLQGLCCVLTTASVQYTLDAFVDEQYLSEGLYTFCVPDDFTPDELVDLNWLWQPDNLPCSLRWEYLSSEGKHCRETTPFVSLNTLNGLWQEQVWPSVSQSPWVQLTLDAASFGNITLKLVLKSEETTSQAWWDNLHSVTTLLWLCRQAMQDTREPQQVVLPVVQKALQQLYRPEMPSELKCVLQFFSSRHRLPAWVLERLQSLLSDPCLSLETVQAIK